MSPSLSPDGALRSDAINDAIRELFPAGAVEPTDPAAYQRLLVEWAEAVKAEKAGQELAA